MLLSGSVHLIRGTDTAPVLAYLNQQEGIDTHGNPDVHVQTHTLFGINDAHELTSRAVRRAIGNHGRVFVVAATTITAEAQNALLKTIEEPPSNARFFFVVPSPESLLPTVLSRAQIHVFDNSVSEEGAKQAAAFLAATPAKRIELLKPFLEKDEDDKRDIGMIIAFLTALEKTLSTKPVSQVQAGLRALYIARMYAGDKGALLKPLLESVALLCPVI